MTICANCKFFDQPAGTPEERGLCRRYPPTATVIMQPQRNIAAGGVAMQPCPISVDCPVMATGWCGEFSPRLLS